MRQMARSLKLDKFQKQMGPFVLIARPPEAEVPGTQMMGLPMNVQSTKMARAEDISNGTLALLFEFEDLEVATLPPMDDQTELEVGRQPDCDLVINDPSVS